MPARKIVREPMLTIDDVAEWLNVKPRFVRRLVAERRIEFSHAGKFVRIPESAVIAFIEAGTVPAVPRRANLRAVHYAS